MPIILSDPVDWELRALEARRIAAADSDPAMRAWLRELAAEYERLAQLTKARQATNKDQ